jgi:hypothetical protein
MPESPESKKRSSKKRSSEKGSNKNKLTMKVIKRFEPNSDINKRLDDGIGRKPPLEYLEYPGGGRKRKTSKRKTSKRKHRKTKR